MLQMNKPYSISFSPTFVCVTSLSRPTTQDVSVSKNDTQEHLLTRYLCDQSLIKTKKLNIKIFG